MTAVLDPVVETELGAGEEDAARVALVSDVVDGARARLSEFVPVLVRRTGPTRFRIVEPRVLVFRELTSGIVHGIGVWIGPRFGVIDLVGGPEAIRQGDTFHVREPL